MTPIFIELNVRVKVGCVGGLDQYGYEYQLHRVDEIRSVVPYYQSPKYLSQIQLTYPSTSLIVEHTTSAIKWSLKNADSRVIGVLISYDPSEETEQL